MTDTQDIQWKRLSVEVAAIVASILLAFAIDAWWDERENRLEETEILLGLQKEFLLHRENLGAVIEWHENALLLYRDLLAASYSGNWYANDHTIDQAIMALISPTTTDTGSGVINGLVSSGRIEMLSNKALREKLAAWEGVFGEVQDDEMNNSNFVFGQIVPYLTRRGIPLSGAFRTQDIDWPTAAISLSEDADVLSRLLSDSAFQVLVEARYGYQSHTTGEYAQAIVAIDEILNEIEKSIAE